MTDDLCRPYPHASRDLEIKLVVVVLAVLTFPVVILRLVSRRSIAGKLELDDWTTLVTAVGANCFHLALEEILIREEDCISRHHGMCHCK